MRAPRPGARTAKTVVDRPTKKNVLVNFHEKVTDRLLSTAAADNGDRLLAKVRLADVLEVEHLTGRAKHYALAAHLDFVMVHAETSAPRFAVELDGAQHWSDPVVQARDRNKDQLCELAGLPLLRITSDFTRREGRWTVLTYLVDAFSTSPRPSTRPRSGARSRGTSPSTLAALSSPTPTVAARSTASTPRQSRPCGATLRRDAFRRPCPTNLDRPER